MTNSTDFLLDEEDKPFFVVRYYAKNLDGVYELRHSKYYSIELACAAVKRFDRSVDREFISLKKVG